MTDKVSSLAREEFWKFADDARARGKDLAEVLDRAGVLLTERRLKIIQASAIEEIAELLATTSPHQWTKGTTQKDVLDAVCAVLRTIAAGRRQ